MSEFAPRLFCLILFLAFAQFAGAKSVIATNAIDKTSAVQSKVRDNEKSAVAETSRVVAEIIKNSYPELRTAQITVKTFHSRADYFRSRFSFSRFLSFRKLHFLILVNPKVFDRAAPPEGIRAIIAHELAHAAYYLRHNRLELFGLVGLQSKSFTARFERGADLQAIKRGYGAGLKQYRQWLYRNIPASKIAAKKRAYFAPEEIDAILEAMMEKPGLIDFWIKTVPRSLAEIQSKIKNKN